MGTSSASGKNGKVKVIVVTGFLGAGKTTLLRRIISWETDLSGTVVIVNEFGDVGIDGLLLKGARSDVVELTSGCVCCTLKIDLKMTLERILEEFQPRQILIEPTGVADPVAIIEAFRDSELGDSMEVDKVITVLEAEYWEQRDYFGSFFLSQLQEAALILLNKIDTLAKGEIPRLLREIHQAIPHAQVVPTIHCRVDPETLWAHSQRKDFGSGLGQFFGAALRSDKNDEQDARRRRVDGSDPHHDHEGGEKELGYVAFSFRNAERLDEVCFRRFTEELPWELFRMKGLVRFRDRTVLVNFVGGQSEWTEWAGAEETRLAFVGWMVNKEETIRKLKRCLL
jgi:G3E family GTPase